MMKTKRIIAMLLTLVMVLGVVPASVFAEPAAPAPTEALEIVETSEPQLPTEEEATEASEEPTTAVTEAAEEVTEATEPVTEAAEEVAEEVTEPVADDPADEIIAEEPVQVPSNDLLAPVPLAATQVTYVKDDVIEQNDAGSKYLIVYEVGGKHYILSYNGKNFDDVITGTVEGNTIKPDMPVAEANILWTAAWYESIFSSSAMYFNWNDTFSFLSVKRKKNLSLNVTARTLYVKDSNALWKDFGDNTNLFLNHDENNWVINDTPISQPTNASFYKRIETTNVQLNVEWWLDGKKVSTEGTRVVEAGSTVSLTKPDVIPAIAKRIENNQIVADLTEVVVDKDQTIRLDYMTDPVKVTVNYYYDAAPETLVDTKEILVNRGASAAIPTSEKINSTEITKKMMDDRELTLDALVVPQNDQSTVSLYYKAVPATLKVEWYVTVISTTDSKTNLYKTDVSEVKVGDTASLNLPVNMKGLKFDSSEVTNDGVLDKAGESGPATVTIKNQGETLVKLTYSYNRGNSDSVLHPDDAASGLEIPEYPDQGSVRINKTATADNFWGNGIANVELSATGIPIKKGVDVILVVDTSGSMKATPANKEGEAAKIETAKATAHKFVDTLLRPNEDGTPSSNRVALVQFSNTDEKVDKTDHLSPENEILAYYTNADNKSKLYDAINGLIPHTGTNYDEAFVSANAILKEALPSREKFIVFLTDGAPGRYNGKQDSSKWDTEPNTEVGGITLKGWHDTALNNKLQGAVDAQTNGATIYTIAFGISGNGHHFNEEQAKQILSQNIATSPAHHFNANQAAELEKVMNNIATDILKAGTDAFVSDQMGAAYDLQMANTVPGKGAEASAQTLDPAPAIKVISHKLYTKADVGKTLNGKTIALEDVGKRTGASRVIETVTFSPDGTKAYSNLINGGKTDIKDGGNIIAKNFAYYVVATDLSNGTTAPAESFIWQIGDITTEEIALSYPVYLTGSMEGTRSDGIYDTNKFARIDYTNYKGHEHTEQIFVKPNMPWGSAVVNYEFYLVNTNGEPVNTRGDVIPFEHRVRIGEPQAKSFKLNSGEQITAKLEAKTVVPKGYELHIPEAMYTVTAVSSGSGTQAISGVPGTGYSGESTHIWKNDPQCINTGVAFGVVNTLTLIPDVVVLDYGKPIAIDVLSNDRVLHNTLYGVCKLGTNTVALGRNLEEGTTAGKTYTGTYGEAAVENDHVLYTLNEFMDGVDKFLYVTKETTTDGNGNATVAGYRYQEVTVMPATTVYYEDNFNSNGEENKDATHGIVYSGGWIVEGNTENGNQDDGSKYEHPYGQDSSYADDSTLSGGSAHVVEGSFDNPPTATFTFNGTGFDLIARTDMNSSLIKVEVFAGKDTNQPSIYSKMTDCKFSDSEVNTGVLNQIPVQTWTADQEKYGTYTVRVTVKVRKSEAAFGKNFYLDAIRIYNPVDPTSSDYKEVQDQYAVDKEANAQIFELRDLLLNQVDFGQGFDGLAGTVYVDGGFADGVKVTEPTLADYRQIGPNNEIYLQKGDSVGIKIIIDGTKAPVAAHLGAKAPFGSAVCKYGTLNDREISINTATDMYYDISTYLDFNETADQQKMEATLVITNIGTDILSLTNLKLTFENEGTQVSFLADEALVQDTIHYTALRMAPPAPEPTEPEVTEPEPTETQPTEPEPTETQPTEPEPTEPTQPEKPSNPIKDFFDKIGGWIGGIFG